MASFDTKGKVVFDPEEYKYKFKLGHVTEIKAYPKEWPEKEELEKEEEVRKTIGKKNPVNKNLPKADFMEDSSPFELLSPCGKKILTIDDNLTLEINPEINTKEEIGKEFWEAISNLMPRNKGTKIKSHIALIYCISALRKIVKEVNLPEDIKKEIEEAIAKGEEVYL